jgi:hypothetical protein
VAVEKCKTKAKNEEHVELPKVEVVPQAIHNPNIETLKKYLNLGIKLIPMIVEHISKLVNQEIGEQII